MATNNKKIPSDLHFLMQSPFRTQGQYFIFKYGSEVFDLRNHYILIIQNTMCITKY